MTPRSELSADSKAQPRAADATLSIIVTVVQGGDYVKSFLGELNAFIDPPPLEVIVPYDASISEVADYSADFPDVTFLDIGAVQTGRPPGTPAGTHELYDRRRAAGLARAKGEIIAILEDRGVPAPDWAKQVMRLHAEGGYHVIGGAIDCAAPVSLLNWAFYCTDFGRYGRPFDSGPRNWVSDVNISYSRDALEATRHLWQERYQEPVVNWFLMDQGHEMLLSEELIVRHSRPKTSLRELIPERFGWGRLFGEIRVREVGFLRRLALAAAGPLIPPVLWLRQGRLQYQKGRLGRYLRALPYVMILTTAWTCGEVWGYITGRS